MLDLPAGYELREDAMLLFLSHNGHPVCIFSAQGATPESIAAEIAEHDAQCIAEDHAYHDDRLPHLDCPLCRRS